MFDIGLNLFYNDQKLRAYSQDLIELTSSAGTKEQESASATKALAKVIERNLPAGSVIKEISLGYHGEIFEGVEGEVDGSVLEDRAGKRRRSVLR